jgi:hypothetical protein
MRAARTNKADAHTGGNYAGPNDIVLGQHRGIPLEFGHRWIFRTTMPAAACADKTVPVARGVCSFGNFELR